MEMEHYSEPRLTSYLFSKASRNLIPLSGTFELSPVCNFSCKMCYVRKTRQEVESHTRPIVTKEQWLQIAREAREEGMLYLLLTGGEPFLWPEFWELYEELSHMGFLISINTNGSLIDEAAVERLKKMPPVRINITLYGASDASYEKLCGVENVFKRVDHAISLLRESGIAVKLNGSLTPYNIEELEACIQYADRRNLVYETNTYMFPPLRRDSSMVGQNERFTPEEAAYYNAKCFLLQNGKDMYQKRMEAILNRSILPPGLAESCVDPVDGKIRCRAGKASFWITWDGYMTPCGMMPEPKADVLKRPFKQAWKELTEFSAELKLSGVCAKCSNQGLCHCCAAMAMAETGTTSGIPSYLCEMVDEMRKQAEEYMASIDNDNK